MIDLVLIPTYNRPDYLTLCLEHLAAADGAETKVVRIFYDRHLVPRDPQLDLKEMNLTMDLVKEFSGKFAKLDLYIRQPHPYVGNPCNFLEAYKEAYANGDARYVYLVEDDVMVGKDFFKWHEAVQERGDYFCTVGWHCIRNKEVAKDPDPTAYIESTRDFSSIGVCWKRANLQPLVRHAVPQYYMAMHRYLAGAFPGSPVPANQWTEQAGVITRLLHETKNRWVAWPTLPRVAHVGISGYHRPGGHRFDGPLEQRVKDLRAAIQNKKLLNSLSKDPFDDVEPLPTIPTDWDVNALHVTQKFPYIPGKLV